MNTKLQYNYTSSNGIPVSSAVVVRGHTQAYETMIVGCCEEEMRFLPDMVHLPSLTGSEFGCSPYPWHQLTGIGQTTQDATIGMDISTLMKLFQKAAEEGWPTAPVSAVDILFPS